MYFGPVDIFVWNTEKSNLSPTHGTVLDIVQIKTKMYYFKLISITTMMNHDLLTKTVSQFDKNKQHVAPVHKNTNLKIPPSEHSNPRLRIPRTSLSPTAGQLNVLARNSSCRNSSRTFFQCEIK